jgi:hypothetical protein
MEQEATETTERTGAEKAAFGEGHPHSLSGDRCCHGGKAGGSPLFSLFSLFPLVGS